MVVILFCLDSCLHKSKFIVKQMKLSAVNYDRKRKPHASRRSFKR